MEKLLVVDNDHLVLQFLKDFLDRQGYSVETAESGLAALDLLNRYVPDVIFIDLIMPNIDGRWLCQVIRKKPAMKNVYIAILSAVAVEEHTDMDSLQADACIAKGPMHEMAQNIIEVLEQFKQQNISNLKKEIIGITRYTPRNVTRELLSVKHHFELLLARMTEGILEITGSGRVVYANPAAQHLFEIPAEKLLGAHFVDIFKNPHRSQLADLIRQIQAARQPVALKEPIPVNGIHLMFNILPLEKEAAPAAIVIINDVTHQKKLEIEKLKTQKLESLRSLVGGIAHDFNNILATIMGNISLALLYLKPEDKLFNFMDQAEKASITAKNLIRQFVQLSGVNVPQKQRVPVDALLRRAVESRMPESPLTVTYRFSENLWPVLIDPEQIDYVFKCLVVNAQEAMKAQGRLEVTAENCTMPAGALVAGWPEIDGRYVRLTFTDDGAGIPGENLNKIFDPYFSTKERSTQKGMGLGLAISRTIIDQHSGHIDIQPHIDVGTTVTLYLPAA